MVAAIEEVNHGYCKAELVVLHLCVSASVNHDIRSKSMSQYWYEKMLFLEAQPADDQMASIEENNIHQETELAMAHQCMVTSVNHHGVGPEIMNSTITTFLNPAGTFVVEERSTENMVADYSELELVDIPDNNGATVKMNYAHLSTAKLENEMDCKEEFSVCSNNLASETQTALQKNSLTPDEELSKDVIPFATSDDGASRKDSTFGVFSSSKRDFNYRSNSYKARIVGKSGSTGAYCKADKPHNPQDHKQILPYLVVISNGSPVKKLVTG